MESSTQGPQGYPKQSKEHIEKKVLAYKRAVEERKLKQDHTERHVLELETENKRLRKDLAFVVNHLNHLHYEVQCSRQSLQNELERSDRLTGFISALVEYTRQTDVFEFKEDTVVDAVETDEELDEPISRAKKKRGSSTNH